MHRRIDICITHTHTHTLTHSLTHSLRYPVGAGEDEVMEEPNFCVENYFFYYIIFFWYFVGAGENEVMEMPQIEHFLTVEGFQHCFFFSKCRRFRTLC